MEVISKLEQRVQVLRTANSLDWTAESACRALSFGGGCGLVSPFREA